MKTTTVTVQISTQRANTGTIEKCIRETLKGLIGYDGFVDVTQTNDRELVISVADVIKIDSIKWWID